MTENEAIARIIDHFDVHHHDNRPHPLLDEAVGMAIKALEQESKMEQFAKWVATEIFDDMWEYNKDSFAEIACRKLAKLGIVRAKGDEWELVESEASE